MKLKNNITNHKPTLEWIIKFQVKFTFIMRYAYIQRLPTESKIICKAIRVNNCIEEVWHYSWYSIVCQTKDLRVLLYKLATYDIWKREEKEMLFSFALSNCNCHHYQYNLATTSTIDAPKLQLYLWKIIREPKSEKARRQIIKLSFFGTT